MYFLDLFSGIGGFALGAYWAGMRFNGHYFSEVDDYATRVYQQRFPDSVPLGDIRNIRGADLPAGDWIIAGGFPCQDISIAGKGAGLAGERSGLWYEYARIIGELQPRYAIMENVGALAFRGLDSVLGSLAEIGYDAEWQDIRASEMGAPHKRERLWILAYPNESGRNASRQREIHICKPDETEGTRPFPSYRKGDLSILRSQYTDEIRARYYRGSNGISETMDRLECLGNSIVPQIAELIFSGIMASLDGNAKRL